MIVEERIYTVRATMTGAFLKIVESGGYAIQSEHLGKPFGYFSTEFGPLNQIVHMWRYTDMEDRARRRAALVADPRWAPIRDQLSALIVSQENKLLIPAKFAPVN
ncbi:NIPSNAP family protein [Arvimicrobium flavum]|uniref:NIPSNAP family protein n=1 Tax=Arvimicrobium flavum TaxID=3393320 RepID=UPI00237B504C|nr:NIPSNAP family protein [Mesorhizobium shangrilense]